MRPPLHIGVPGAAENIAWRAGFVFSLAVEGRLGTAALATHAYTMQLIQLIMLFGVTPGLSVAILVRHLVGAGQLHHAHRLLRRWLSRGLLMAAAVSLAVSLFSPVLMRGSTHDPHNIAAGATLL